MLDSLVRVSRRVGQVTDRFATDPEPAAANRTAERTRLADTDDSPRSNARPGPAPQPTAQSDLPRSADAGQRRPVCNTGTLRNRPPSPEAYDCQRTGRGVPSVENAPADRTITQTPVPFNMRRRPGRPADGLNPTDRLCGPLRLPLNGFTYY